MCKDDLYKYEIIVDGKNLGILYESARTQKELKRLKGLKGIEIKEASFEALRTFNAKTKLPERIYLKMRDLYLRSNYKSTF